MGQTIDNELDEPKISPPAAASPATGDDVAAGMPPEEKEQVEAALEQVRQGAALPLTLSLALGRVIYNIRHKNKPTVPFDDLRAEVQERFSAQAVVAARTFAGLYAPPPGEVAYTTYCAERGWLGFNGDVLPLFQDSKPEVQLAWEVAARTVLDTFKMVEHFAVLPQWLFKVGDRVRHKKSGAEYLIIGDKASGFVVEANGAPAYTYVAAIDGSEEIRWVRPAVEMEERFELVSEQPAATVP